MYSDMKNIQPKILTLNGKKYPAIFGEKDGEMYVWLPKFQKWARYNEKILGEIEDIK